MDRGTRLGFGPRLPAAARPVRHRLFLGRSAPHRTDVARARERSDPRRAWRKAVHRYLQRYWYAKPPLARTPFAVAVTVPAEAKALAGAVLRGRPGDYVRSWTEYRRRRGMNKWH